MRSERVHRPFFCLDSRASLANDAGAMALLPFAGFSQPGPDDDDDQSAPTAAYVPPPAPVVPVTTPSAGMISGRRIVPRATAGRRITVAWYLVAVPSELSACLRWVHPVK